MAQRSVIYETSFLSDYVWPTLPLLYTDREEAHMRWRAQQTEIKKRKEKGLEKVTFRLVLY